MDEALLRRRRGYVSRLKAAERVSNTDAAERLRRAIASLDEQLESHVCDVCGFEAKNAGGLASHRRSHEE